MFRDKLIAGTCLIIVGLIFILNGMIFHLVLKSPMTYTDAGGTAHYLYPHAYDNQTALMQNLFFGTAFIVLGMLVYFSPIMIDLKWLKKR